MQQRGEVVCEPGRVGRVERGDGDPHPWCCRESERCTSRHRPARALQPRTGPPNDDEIDLGTGTWAGVLPIATAVGAPIADEHMPPGVPPPTYATAYRRSRRRRAAR